MKTDLQLKLDVPAQCKFEVGVRAGDTKVSAHNVSEAIKAAFERQALLDAEKIEVVVEGSKVALHGFTSSIAEMDVAERVARLAEGVTEVENHLLMVV